MAGIDLYTKLMLHMDGTDDAQVFTDDSDSEHVVTVGGDIKTEDTQKKFGVTSAWLDGTGDYLTVPNHADWDFGTGDWTIDFWFWGFSNQQSHSGIFSTLKWGGSLGYCIGFGVDADNQKIRLQSWASGSYQADLLGPSALSAETWYHIAIVRNGNTLSLYQDGILDDTLDCTGYDYDDESLGAILGRLAVDYDSYYINGYLDEFRVSKGVARWTANFTPPTAAYDRGWSGKVNGVDSPFKVLGVQNIAKVSGVA